MHRKTQSFSIVPGHWAENAPLNATRLRVSDLRIMLQRGRRPQCFFYKRRQRVSYLAQEENARICLHRGEAPSNTEAYCLLTHRLIGKVLRLGVLAQALNRKSFRLHHHARRGQILLLPGRAVCRHAIRRERTPGPRSQWLPIHRQPLKFCVVSQCERFQPLPTPGLMGT